MTRIRNFISYFIIHNSYFTVFLLSLAALRPILQRNLPCSDDVAFHLLRLTQLDWLLRNGILFSRWAPDMAQGYGYPIFNFYAPLSYYVAELFSGFGQNLHLGVRLTFAFGMLASGLTMYRLARDHFSHPAALVSAVAYMYAPYHAYDILFRGNLAESFAWWLLPLSLFFIGRLARTADFKYFLPTTLTYAAILLTHNAFALIFSPVLGVYGLWVAITSYKLQVTTTNLHNPQPLIPHPSSLFSYFILHTSYLTLSLLAALTLTTFFWLPALLERNLIHTDRLLVPPVFVYWGNFLTLSELLAPPRFIFTDLINPSPPRTIGLVTALITLPAILYVIINVVSGIRGQVSGIRGQGSGERTQHPASSPFTIHNSQFILHTSYFILLTLLTAFLMLPPSRWLWDNLPLLEFVQFPWRFLGITALTAAFLCGASAEIIGHWLLTIDHWPFKKYPTLLLLTFHFSLLTTLILSDLFYLDTRYCEGLLNPTLDDIAQFERDTDTIGTTAKGEYVPLTSKQFPPQAARSFIAPLPDTAEIYVYDDSDPINFWLQLTATEPFTLTANQFYYPGWQATINNQPVKITPSDPYGLIQIPVPIGDRHTISFEFGETPLRRTTNWISAVTLLTLIGIGTSYKLQVTSKQSSSAITNTQHATRNTKNHNSQFPIHNSQFTIFALALFAFIVFAHPLNRQYLSERAAANQPPVATYAGGISLLNYQIANRTMPADGQLPITLWFKADRQPDANYQTFVRLVDTDGRIWSPRESTRPRVHRAFYNPRTWPLDEFAEDMHLLEALSGTPPGLYTIQLLVFDRDTLAPAALTDGRTELSLGTIQLTRPDHPFEPTPQYPAAEDFGEVKLIGYNLDREEADVGEPFLLTLFWETLAPPTGQHEIELLLVAPPYPDEIGPVGFFTRLPLVDTNFDPQTWREGDVWRAQHSFRLPASLESLTYTWVLRFCPNGRCQGQSELVDLGPLAMTAPTRNLVRPDFNTALSTRLGPYITLLGASYGHPSWVPPVTNITELSNPLEITLFWQTDEQTTTSYRVFVQLLNEAGQPVAVSDQEPAVWSRPTTSWIRGEYITDPHTLQLPSELPSGDYTLIAGMYDPTTGQRLTTREGADVVIIQQLTINN